MEDKPPPSLDLDDQRVRCGTRSVQLGGKAFQMLCLLVRHPNRLLTKAFLLDTIWGDVLVNEGQVKEYIHDIRLALGDDPRKPKFIETIRGRGYRYLGGIEISGVLARADVQTRSDSPSVAVLPFSNLSDCPEEEYFADGLSEEIITALSYVPWLFVIARNSSFRYKGTAPDPRKVGQELGTRYVLEGSVRRSGSRLRATARLVDADTANQIWARRYDSRMDDVFDLQDEVARAVVGSIGTRIQLAEMGRAARKRPNDLTAYDLYLRARAALNAVKIEAAAELLDAAIARDPDYAKAKSVRAWCATLIGWQFTAPDNARRDAALRLAEEALASPDADAETRAYAAYSIGFMGDRADQAERALALLDGVTRECPNFAWAWASFALMQSYHGDATKATALAERSLRLSPGDPQSFRCEMAICKAHLVLGQFDKCLDAAKRGLRKNPDITFLQMCRVCSLVQLGKSGEARAAADDFRRRNPGFHVGQWRALTRNWLAWGATSKMLAQAMRAVGIPN